MGFLEEFGGMRVIWEAEEAMGSVFFIQKLMFRMNWGPLYVVEGSP